MNTIGLDVKNLPPGDPKLIESIVNHFKSQGIFDQFRKDCLADVDTKPAYQNLRQRVDGNASKFLNSMQWRADLNKNQLRDSVRRQIHESGMLNIGVDRIVDQVVNPKIYQVFMPKITEVVHQFLGIKDGNVEVPSQIKPELDVVDKPKEPPVLEPSNTPPHSPKTFSSFKTESIRSEANTPNSTVPCNTGHPISDPSTSIKVECVVPSDNRDATSTTPRSDFPTPEAAIQEMNEDTIKLEIKKALEALMETSAAVKGDDEAALRRSKLNIASSSDAVTPEKKKESKLWEAVKQVSGSEAKPKIVDSAKKDPETGKAKKSESTPVKPVEMAPKPKLEKTKSDPVKKLDVAKPKESDKAVSKVKQLDRKDSKAKCGESATKPKLKEQKVEKPKSSEVASKSEKSPDGKKILHKPKPIETPVAKSSATTDKKKDNKPKDDKPVKTDAAKKIVKSASNSGASKDTKTKCVESTTTTTKHGNVAKPVIKVKPDTADGKKIEAKSTQKSQKESTSKKVSGEEAKQKQQKEVVKQKQVPQVKEAEKAKVTKPEDKMKVDKDKKEGKEKPITHKECEVRLVKLEDRDSNKKKPHSEEKIKVPEVIQEQKEERLDELSPPPLPLPPVCEGKPEESDVDTPVVEEIGSKRKHQSTAVVAVNRKSSRDSRDVDALIGFAAGVREYSDGGYAGNDRVCASSTRQNSVCNSIDEDMYKVARKKRRIKNAESSEEEREEEDAQSVGVLSDVTVSSVHTSDLSDFDDHISLTDAEEENAKKNEDPATAGDGKPKKRGRGRPRRHRPSDQPSDNTTAEKDPSSESEPRRELRRQRRLNPKYASDDFSSIFNKHKGRGAGIFHGELEEKETDSRECAIITMPPSGDHADRVQPDCQRGSVSTQGDRKRTARGQVSSPSDSGEASYRLHGENLEMENKDTKPRSSSCSGGSSSPPAKKLRRDRSGSLPDGGNVAISVQKETRHKSQKLCSSTGNVTRRKTAS